MSIENLGRPIAAAELMKGNNFWLRLKSILNTPRNMLAIEYTVNAGGGARGKRPESFIILNVSKDRESLHHLNGQVISSRLVPTVPVHESTLKAILSLAKKGDRKLVDIGSDLIIGQIDLMKATFPHIFSSGQSNQQNTPTDEDDTMSNAATTMTWESLFRNISDIIGTKAPNPTRLQDVPNNIGVLAINVKGASPAARFETSLTNFRSIQKTLQDKITKLQPGQYIRVEFTPQKENIFIGDMAALLKLRALVTPAPAPVLAPPVAPAPALLSAPAPAPALPSAPEASTPARLVEPTTRTATLAEAVAGPSQKVERKVRWTIFYTQFGSVNKELEADKISNQYGVIEYKDTDKGLINLGLFVSLELCQKLGIKIREDSFEKIPSSEIMTGNIQARAVLEDNRMIAILKFRRIHTLIFPMDSIPEALKNHIQSKPSTVKQTELKTEQLASPTASASQDLASEEAQRNLPISDRLSLVEAEKFAWNDLRSYSVKIYESLNQGQGYCLINYGTKVIGIAVSNKVDFSHGQSDIQKVSYSAVDIGKRISEALKDLQSGRAVVVTKFNATRFTVYPISSVPQGIASLILGKDSLPTTAKDAPNGEKVGQVAEAGVDPSGEETRLASGLIERQLEVGTESKMAMGAVPAPSPVPEPLRIDFKVAAVQAIAVPDNLSERIAQRKAENAVLARVKEAQRILSDLQDAQIFWNGVELRLTTHPTLVNCIPDLADHYALQVGQAEITDDLSWISAFERAVSHDGLFVFKQSNQEPSILVTKDPDFFANVAREFC
jgi:hypothetical protein